MADLCLHGLNPLFQACNLLSGDPLSLNFTVSLRFFRGGHPSDFFPAYLFQLSGDHRATSQDQPGQGQPR
ncbi:hypothetical protein BKN47_31960 [Pseudomonas aeruginosa]|nr:hypothetical protein BKN47_31960 [Pseudomonas aeruginosa]